MLACVGLLRRMSYLVSQRTHDIGVRLALGAVPGDIFRLVVGRGMALAAAGALLGLGRGLLAVPFARGAALSGAADRRCSRSRPS